MLDVASAIAKLQERRKYCDHAYQMACANVMDLAFVSTEASPIRNVAAWRWRRDFADKAIVQLRGAYDKGASDVVKMVLAAEPAPGEIERMLEHLPRRFAEGCKVANGGTWVEGTLRSRAAYASTKDLENYGGFPKVLPPRKLHDQVIVKGGHSFETVRHWLRDGSYLTEDQAARFCEHIDIHRWVFDFDRSNGEVHINDGQIGILKEAFWHIEAAAVALGSAFLRGVRGEVVFARGGSLLGIVH